MRVRMFGVVVGVQVEESCAASAEGDAALRKETVEREFGSLHKTKRNER